MEGIYVKLILVLKLTFNNAHIVMRFLRYPTLLHGSTLGFRGKPLRKQCWQ